MRQDCSGAEGSFLRGGKCSMSWLEWVITWVCSLGDLSTHGFLVNFLLGMLSTRCVYVFYNNPPLLPEKSFRAHENDKWLQFCTWRRYSKERVLFKAKRKENYHAWKWPVVSSPFPGQFPLPLHFIIHPLFMSWWCFLFTWGNWFLIDFLIKVFLALFHSD